MEFRRRLRLLIKSVHYQHEYGFKIKVAFHANCLLKSLYWKDDL